MQHWLKLLLVVGRLHYVFDDDQQAARRHRCLRVVALLEAATRHRHDAAFFIGQVDLVGGTGQSLDQVLPPNIQWIAHNYNHLHEQPVIFYALCVYTHLVGVWDGLNVGLAWAYVAIRIVHSLIQVTTNFVPLRFAVFNLGSLVLAIIALRNVLGLFGI